ncbi:MAG: hypothetical protein M0R75_11190 [Dehalococcoidia bacterium]|nr:hypothetical protein [Dehalococcoidia bacterium]
MPSIRRTTATIAAAAVIAAAGSFVVAGPVAAASPPAERPGLKELFTPTWDSRDPLFIRFPNIVTPLTPDGAYVCLVPTPCILTDDADDAVDEVIEGTRGGSVGAGYYGGGGSFFMGGSSSGGKTPIVTVGEPEQVDE